MLRLQSLQRDVFDGQEKSREPAACRPSVQEKYASSAWNDQAGRCWAAERSGVEWP
jgi:hypothetical protein